MREQPVRDLPAARSPNRRAHHRRQGRGIRFPRRPGRRERPVRRVRGRRARVAITYFGDGATSEGDFHEAMNFAGVYQLPVLFLCENNQYAISLRRDRQTAAPTIAGKAEGYGFPGVLVDGNDQFAVYGAAELGWPSRTSVTGPRRRVTSTKR